MKYKTTNAQRRAVANYESRSDRTTVYLKTGYKEKIKRKYNNISISDYINKLIENDLNIVPENENETINKLQEQNENINAVDPADVFINYNNN